MHDAVARVTDRIIERSREERAAYLARIHNASQDGPARGNTACSNLAHVMAAASPIEKKLTKKKAGGTVETSNRKAKSSDLVIGASSLSGPRNTAAVEQVGSDEAMINEDGRPKDFRDYVESLLGTKIPYSNGKQKNDESSDETNKNEGNVPKESRDNTEAARTSRKASFLEQLKLQRFWNSQSPVQAESSANATEGRETAKEEVGTASPGSVAMLRAKKELAEKRFKQELESARAVSE